MNVSRFELEAPPPAADRVAQPRQEPDGRVERQAASQDGEPRPEEMEEPGYGHGV